MNYQIITKNKDLEEVCALAREADVVMLDTEFVRIRTYYPQLGLIQLFDGKQLSLIDPTELTDMTSFVELLKDTSVLKVLHACGEDLEVFQNAFGCTPFPMVDTQLMAAFPRSRPVDGLCYAGGRIPRRRARQERISH